MQDFAFDRDIVSSTNIHEAGNNLAPKTSTNNISSGVSAFAGVPNGNFK